MTGRERLEYEEKRKYLYNRDGGRCVICNKQVGLYEFQWAHIIAQEYIPKYGKDIINHPLNAKVTCSLYCNGRVSMRQHPVAEKELISKIRALLGE